MALRFTEHVCSRCGADLPERGYGHYPDHGIEDCLASLGARVIELERRAGVVRERCPNCGSRAGDGFDKDKQRCTVCLWGDRD